jgi:methanogenic corrinoid protein MtbC1
MIGGAQTSQKWADDYGAVSLAIEFMSKKQKS